ncbi:MAG: hypothetical protein J6586_12535 [Snodgrassella sp.]|nr:hypothetical protein [Snodgrassella sp.]
MNGSAKIFVNYECHARTWRELKEGLIREFSKKFNTWQIHRKLQETKKKKKRDDEGCTAYMYRMLGKASQINIEEEAKISYIIYGIRDKELKTKILYGAKSIKELKENLIIYEEQESRIAESTMRPVRAKDNGRYKQSEDVGKYKRCYNCGDEEHVCAECPNKSRGPKCFKCREYGYIASRCDNLSESIKEVGSVYRL